MTSRLKTYFGYFRLRDAVALAVLSLAVSLLGVVGTSYIQGEGYYTFSATDTFIYVGLWALVFAAVALLIDIAYDFSLPRWHTVGTHKPRQHRIRRVLAKITPRWSKKSVLLCALVMFVLWLPYAIIDYPDSLLYDTVYQIRQAYPAYHPVTLIPFDSYISADTLVDAYFTDHHPLFDTLIYAAFGMTSDALTGDWSIGVFVFVLLQGATTALAFTAGVAYLRRRSCPLPLCFALFAFFCLMPVYACFATSMMKDSLFCTFYIPYFIVLAEVVRTRGECLKRPRTVVLFILLGLLLCLTRKMGMYLVIPTALIAALMYRQRWLPLLGQALACALMMLLVLPYAVFPLLNVASGGGQESLSLLYQQTAKFYKDHYKDMTTPEWVIIGKVLPTGRINEKYRYDLHDSIKFMVKRDASAEDFANYLRVWAAQGLRNPESYLAATMGVAGEFFSFEGRTKVRILDTNFNLNDPWYEYATQEALAKADADASSESDDETTDSEDAAATSAGEQEANADAAGTRNESGGEDWSQFDRLVVVQPDWLVEPRHALAEGYDAVTSLPGINVLFTNATYLFWLPCIALFVAWRRRLPIKLLFVPFGIVLFFCVIGPMASTRYALPSIYAAPLLMGLVASFIRMQWHPPRMRVRVRRKR